MAILMSMAFPVFLISLLLKRQMLLPLMQKSFFIQGEIDEVNLIFTHFKSALDLEPKTLQLLPVRPFESENQDTSLYLVL